MYKQSLSALLLGLSLSSGGFAANISLNGTIPGIVPIYQTGGYGLRAAVPAEKTVLFERIVLSPDAKKLLAQHIDTIIHDESVTIKKALSPSLPGASSLGMNGVPVLDQGQHGTCVAFAVTGAIDAAYTEGAHIPGDDHFSELCSLELGSTLEAQDPNNLSGWDGSWGTIVLNQMTEHGLITKAYQESRGCAGVRDYPLMAENDHGRPMSVADFHSHSEKVIPPVSYKVILHSEEAFAKNDNVLQQVKAAISAGHRVTFGILLDVDQGYNGALGTYKVSHDTWILTKEIAKHAKAGTIEAGHEMIIVGYDDNIAVKDPQPKRKSHKGLLTLRNSWGKEAGDQGTYYMTYDHFQALKLEAIEVIPTA
jgi:hypothetical protein